MPNRRRRWRNDSIFGDGPRAVLDRNERARYRYLLRAHARARRISPKAEWVGIALLKRLSDEGRCDPAHATLAADSGCSERTVRRATCAMRNLGLLRWQTRLVRDGWRTEQTSNAYELVPLATEVCVIACGGQVGRETRKVESNPMPQPSSRAVEEAQEGLDRVRRMMEARLRGAAR